MSIEDSKKTTPTGSAVDSLAGSTGKPSPKARDPYFSNAKYILITTVVCGHVWASFITDDTVIRGIYFSLYAFHMPAFVFISGYFSKTFTARSDQVRRLITGILAPYLIFSLLYGIMRSSLGEPFSLSLFHPYYVLWFLAALFVWRLTSPLWRMVKYPVSISVAISIFAIAMELPSVFDFGRIFLYLPFFVAGMHAKREWFTQLSSPVVKLSSLVLSGAIIACFIVFNPRLDSGWIYFNAGADQMNLNLVDGVIMKPLMLAATLVLMTTFFAWVPRSVCGLTSRGDLTMYPFLLHGFVVKTVDSTSLYDLPGMQTAWAFVAATIAAVLLTFALTSKPIRWLSKPFVEPSMKWLLVTPQHRTQPAI